MKNKYLVISFFLINLLFFNNSLKSQVRLPKLISDSMVLQRDIDLKIWGWASPGEQITINFINKTYKTITNPDGKWQVKISPAKAGGPYDMAIEGKNKLIIKNILMGDVWICSGQSNMVTPMERVQYKYPEEIANASNYRIREFIVPDKYDHYKPLEDVNSGRWTTVNGKSIFSFTAVGYFFAKTIFEKYHIPIGLIKTCVGGSPVEAWMSEDALAAFPEKVKQVEKYRDTEYVNTLMRKSRDERISWYREISEKDKGRKINEKPFTDPSLDVSSWSSMTIPSFWADEGLGMINGILWFRKDIEVPASMIGKPAKLWLGRVVDSDSAFINSKFVGTITYQYPPSIFDVPAGLLKEGKNTIVIKVINNAGKGGFIKDKTYALKTNDESIDLQGDWKYCIGATNRPMQGYPGPLTQALGLYNGMISPLLNYRIKGVLWYQGESNVDKPDEYHTLFSTLISNWRQKWGQGDFPFLYVQLPNYMETQDQPSESNWALLREAQLKTLSVKNTAMAVAVDLGEWNDIHPLNKKDVGIRLALAAQNKVYKDKNIIFSGPVYQSMKTEGNKIILSFTNTGNGLIIKDGIELKQFAIAGHDKKFIWAKAKITGNKVVVWNETITNPVAVRYAWANNPEGANLYNFEGLPASPFRTDQ